MPLRTIDPHEFVQQRVATELLGLMRHLGTKGGTAIGTRKAASLGLAAPHPIFNLGLDAIDSPMWLSRTEMTGWRYFVMSDGNVIAATEASSTSIDGPISGTLTNEGPFVAGSVRALELTELRPVIANGNFVLGLLRIPALYVVALWLRSAQQSENLDWFVPVAPAPEPLKANALTKPADFVKSLRYLKSAKLVHASGDSASN